jgi:hypothetical protein
VAAELEWHVIPITSTDCVLARLLVWCLQLMHILVVLAMGHLFRGATLDWRDFSSGASCPS